MSVRLHRRLNSTPLTGESPGLVYYTPKKEIQKHSRFNKFSKNSLCVSSTECFKRREKSKRCRFFQYSPRTPLYIRMKSIKKRLNFNDSLGSNEDQNADSNNKQYQKGTFEHSKTNSIPQVIVSSTSPQNKLIINECDNRISFVEIAFPNYLRTATPNTHKLFLCISPSKKSKLLGRGRFGRVIEKTYKDKKVAVKIINNHGNRYINSLHNEQNGINLKHPNVVNVIKVAWITTNTRISHSIILMNSYSNGCNLQMLLDNDDYDIDLCRIIRYSIHICRGLQYIHSHNILHLDIKPKNILAFPDDLCKICDFGTSIKFGEKLEENNILHQLQGTIRYCSPELLQGRSPTTASDVYSLGITFWQMEHRALPYGFNIREESLIYQVVKNNLRPKITHCVFSYPYMLYNKVYERCWNKNPIKRLTLDVILRDISYIYRYFCDQIF